MHGTSSPSKLLNWSSFGGCVSNRGGLGAALHYTLGVTDTYQFPCSSLSGSEPAPPPSSNTPEKSIEARKPFTRNELKCTMSSSGLPLRTFAAYATGEPSQSPIRTSNTPRPCP